jgi:phosphatidylserine/phosphatidylglycerophosphate/cardiolipin synthase-like enzyme
MKNVFFLFTFLASLASQSQPITIAEARDMPLEVEVTVSGTVTNGQELGIIRYLQDGTGGIPAYGTQVEDVLVGDSITVTGVLKDYNGLLELDPITELTNHGQANAPIAPQPFQLSQIGESTEALLASVPNCTFAAGGNTFTSNTSYNISDDSGDSEIYVRSDHPLVGELIPIGPVTITAISSQFTFDGFGGYQLLPRNTADIISPNPLNIISSIDLSDQTENGYSLSWTTDVASTTEAYFTSDITGANLEGNHITEPTSNGTDHTLSFESLNPGEVYFTQIFSVLDQDTAFSNVGAYATVSESSGEIDVLFNQSVDTTFATSSDNYAISTNLKDSIIAYIDRAQTTLDIACYNINNTQIVNAVNEALDRGVQIRYIGEGQNNNIGLGSLNDEIPFLLRENADGSGMHNKFIVTDYQDTDSSFVLTGSTNFTNGNLFSDPNNLVVVQDRSLAKAYTIEFNEMWGSNGAEPNPASSKFGSEKTNNTPEKFKIGQKDVELYFSPSDATTSGIDDALQSADTSIDFALLLITQNQLASTLVEKAGNFFVTVTGILNDVFVNGSDYEDLISNGADVVEHTPDELLHHKYAIIDHSEPNSDPTVITGSHNWSASAETVNDENTLIIHDADIANQFYQEFMARYNELVVSVAERNQLEFGLYPNPTAGGLNIELGEEFTTQTALSIYDVSGKKVLSENLVGASAGQKQQIDVSSLVSGVYILALQSGDKIGVQKLVVE